MVVQCPSLGRLFGPVPKLALDLQSQLRPSVGRPDECLADGAVLTIRTLFHQSMGCLRSSDGHSRHRARGSAYSRSQPLRVLCLRFGLFGGGGRLPGMAAAPARIGVVGEPQPRLSVTLAAEPYNDVPHIDSRQPPFKPL